MSKPGDVVARRDQELAEVSDLATLLGRFRCELAKQGFSDRDLSVLCRRWLEERLETDRMMAIDALLEDDY